MIDADQIITNTKEVFFKSKIQKEKYSKITEFIDLEEYKALHKTFLTPLAIKIDVSNFLEEIKQFDNFFEPWGNEHRHLPRFGLALVNQDGSFKSKDPINGSLYEWNKNNPNEPIIESDCRSITPAMNLDSLRPLNIFNGHWYRSNILKWHEGAEFKPHIDAIIPSPWLRLWGTTSSTDMEIRFWNPSSKKMQAVYNIEPGRIYLIDTSLVHDAESFGDVFQFFLSVDPGCSKKIKSLI